MGSGQYDIPRGALYILRRLEAGGHQAWLVGGCVRDLLRGERPHDWDICTSALPEETAACCSAARVHPTGIRHGTVLLALEDGSYEVTTFRTETGYRDHRHPDAVRFVTSLREDLDRRDFTINAMAYHPERGLVDLFGGQADLAQRVIRCVGDPARRMEEDALRILRGMRFAARFSYSIAPETGAAMLEKAPLLRRIARERIGEEWRGFLRGEGIAPLLRELKAVCAALFPECAPLMARAAGAAECAWDRCARVAGGLPADDALRCAVLLSPLSMEAARRHLDGLRCDGAFRREVETLLALHQTPFPTQERALRALLLETDEAILEKWALWAGEERRCAGAAADGAEMPLLLLKKTAQNTPCRTLMDLALSGADLRACGVKPGPELGRLLRDALRAAADGEVENRREALLRWVLDRKEEKE